MGACEGWKELELAGFADGQSCPTPTQVLTQLLLYYTRFLDLVKHAYPQGPPFAQYILSIPTLMNEIKHFSRNF